MVKNLGTIDRASRIFLAILFAVLIITGVVHHGVGLVIFSVFGLYFLLTAIVGFCILYTLVGIHTLRTKSGVDD
jgi:hypothetical protein